MTNADGERGVEEKTKIGFTYIVEGPVARGNVDTYFYSYLPDLQTEVIDLHTGSPVTDIPPAEQSIRVTGSSTVSYATLAAIIQDYLRDRKSKIVIEGKKKRVEYQGPKLKTKAEEIEAMIYSLRKDSAENNLTIMAYHLSSA
jgi:NADPH-dependent 2,4-dienoyl-CoA reductase/sulfur reductase-like enzyme